MKTLEEAMEFDQVVKVNSDGSFEELKLYAPDVYCCDGEVIIEPDYKWEPLRGFSHCGCADCFVMHPSEFIGGGLERHILANPGIYVNCPIIDEEEHECIGWAVLKHV